MILNKITIVLVLFVPILVVAGIVLHSSSQAQDIRPVIEDLTPPELVAVAISPNLIDTDFMDVTITVTVRVTDDLSGVEHVAVRIVPMRDMPASGHRQDYYGGASVKPSQNTVTLDIPVTLLQYSKEGEWGIASISLYDRIGNSAYYLHSEWDSQDPDGNERDPACETNDSYICLPNAFDIRFINQPGIPFVTPTPSQTPEPTPTAPATVMPVCTPPPCPPEGDLVCREPDGCPGGCGYSCQFRTRLPHVRR